MNGPMPWKPECNPIRWIPGCDNPYSIKIDPAHTFAMGFGKDFCASSLIAMSHIGLFGPGSIHAKLENAYNIFREWVHSAKEHCKLTEFSLKAFKVTSFLWLFLC